MKINQWGEFALHDAIDDSDFFPRYYFNFEVAKSETILFLETRKQFVNVDPFWYPDAGNPDGSCHREND